VLDSRFHGNDGLEEGRGKREEGRGKREEVRLQDDASSRYPLLHQNDYRAITKIVDNPVSLLVQFNCK
jgi:hypothetical protein